LRESLDSNYKNRLFVGLIILLVVTFSFILNLDLYLISIIILLVTYDFYNIKITNLLILVILFLLPFISNFLFTKLIRDTFYIYICLVILILFFNQKFKKELFLLSVYLFCVILFNILSSDRNIFYIILFISFFNDTTAYIFGKSIGGPLIIPKISPKKTWSGTIISFVLSTSLLFFLKFDIFLSATISIFLFIGDIFFSYFKRLLNLDDFSSILKSHGGILDRIDSMFFVTIIFQIYLII
tara:strand:- start:312 stop:1034 length:723 start_codon:yes stop_codon:yes gene_type:complete